MRITFVHDPPRGLISSVSLGDFWRNWFFRCAGVAAILLLAGCASQNRRVVFPEATVNGHSAHLILDTGSSSAVLVATSAYSFGVNYPPLTSEYPIHWFDVDIPSALSDSVPLTVGGQKLVARFIISDHFRWTDSFLGWPNVRDNILLFDGAQRTVRALPALPADLAGWQKLKVRSDSVLTLETTLPDGKTGAIEVDSGSPFGVILSPACWEKWRPDHLFEKVTDTFTIAGVTLTDVPVSKAKWTKMDDDFICTWGMEALERMELIVDNHEAVAYARAGSWPVPPATDAATSGNWTVADNVKVSPASFYLFAANYEWDTKHPDLAKADFAEALTLEPDNADIWGERGGLRQQHGDYAEALVDFNRALELDPTHADWLLYRGIVKDHLGDYPGAIADFNQALVYTTNRANVLFLRGITLMHQDDPAGASADFDQAIALNPKNTNAYLARAALKQKTGDADGAIADTTRIIELNPDQPDAYIVRGMVEWDQDDYRHAIVDLSQFIKMKPTEAIGYDLRASAHQMLGEFTLALADYDQAVALAKDDNNYAQVLRQLLRLRQGRAPGDFAQTVAGWKDGWDKSLGLFVAGKLNEAAFLEALKAKAAETTDPKKVKYQRSTAFYIIGMMRLIEKDLSGAREAFEIAMAAGNKGGTDYKLAHAELARLDGAQAK